MDTYVPVPGDIIFFEHDDQLISEMVAELGGPSRWGLKVSHCAIVVADSKGHPAAVVENALKHPLPANRPVGEVRPNELAAICTKPLQRAKPLQHTGRASRPPRARRLLVVRRGGLRSVDVADVVAMATQFATPPTDYSIELLLLAGLAEMHRRLPCAARSDEFWKAVHLHARVVVAGAKPGYVGTCAGTLAEIEEAAGQSLDIREPDCPNRLVAWWKAPKLVKLIEELAVVAWREAERVDDEKHIIRPVEAFVREGLARYTAIGHGPPSTKNVNNVVRFGIDDAVGVLDVLKRFHLLRKAEPYRVFHHLLITFGVLNHLVHAEDDGDHPPAPYVYPPLMSLDLILRKFDVKPSWRPTKPTLGPDELAPFEAYLGP